MAALFWGAAAIPALGGTGPVLGPTEGGSGNSIGPWAAPFVDAGGGASRNESARWNDNIIACNFSGSDVGAQLNAAIAALPSAGGTVDARCLSGTLTATTAIVVGNGTNKVTLRLGPALILVSATVVVNKGSFIEGQNLALGVGSTNYPTVIEAATGSNLSAVVQLNTGYGGLRDVVVDANKAGNASNTNGDAIFVNAANRPELRNVTAQNAPRHGYNVLNSEAGKMSETMAIDNGSNGLYCSGTSNAANDWMISLSEFEANGAQGLNLSGCSAWRIEHNDFGGNIGGGILLGGSGSAPSNGVFVIGNQFGANQAHDIDIEGTSGAAANATIVANQFITMSGTANAYDNIHMQNSCNNNVMGNTINSNVGTGQSRYGIAYFASNGVTSPGCNVVDDNVLTGTFGTAPYFQAPAPYPSVENRIINPDFLFDQYHAGSAHAGTSGFFTDRWSLTSNAGQTWNTTAQYTGACTAGAKFGLYLAASGNVTPASTTIDAFTQNIDGGDMQDFKMSASSAQPFVLSFWASASQAGTYSIALNNGLQNRSFVTTVSLTTSCAYYSVYVPGDTGGSWNSAAGQTEMTVNFDLGSGTNYQTSTLNQWQTGRFFEATGAVQASTVSSFSATFNAFRITLGAQDRPRLPRSVSAELDLAREFYRTSFPLGTAPATGAGVAGALCTLAPATTAYASIPVLWTKAMRATPTITTYNPVSANANWRDVTAGADIAVSVDPASAKSPLGFQLTSTAGPSAANDNLCIHYAASAGY